MQIELNDILVFVAVVEENSFTGAADRLGLPKSTVSRKVTRLEDHLGAKLLMRSTRSLKITEVGQRFYDHGTRIARELAAAEDVVHELKATPHGLLRVTLPVEMGPNMMSVLRAFMETYPEVELDLDLTNRYVDIVAEGYDLAIRAGERIETPGLMARKLNENATRIVASPEYFERQGRPKSPADLSSHECILFPNHSKRHWELEVDGEMVKIPVSGKLGCNNLSSVLAAAEVGLGIAYLPELFCAKGLEDGTLEEILRECSTVRGAMWCVYPENRNPLPKVRAFIDFLIAKRNSWNETI